MSQKTPISNTKRSEGDQLSFIWKNVESIGTCMLNTTDGPRLRARPMRAFVRSGQNVIHFITARTTDKPEEVAANPHVCLTFIDKGANTYIALSGMIHANEDRETLRSLWSRAEDAYFTGGAEDPDALLLTFTPERGEYWDAPSNPVVMAIEFIRASVTGDKPSLGENAEVSMRSSLASS
jgi:general stress protein 26